MCICSLWYPACNAHAPYCHVWPAPIYNIFPHFITPLFSRGRKITEHRMCVLIFSTAFVSNILILRRNEQDMIKKCLLVFTYSTRYPCPILTKLEFSRQIFEKFSNIKFRENSSSESRVVPCGRADEQTWRSYIVAFRNFPNAPQKKGRTDVAHDARTRRPFTSSRARA